MKFAKEMYSKVALMKSAYSFTDRAYIHLDADDFYYYVVLRPKSGFPDINEDEFVNEMLCQSVRHEVYRQTKNLRELLVARAMASTVVRDSEVSSGIELVDEDSENDDLRAKQILKDWFDADENA